MAGHNLEIIIKAGSEIEALELDHEGTAKLLGDPPDGMEVVKRAKEKWIIPQIKKAIINHLVAGVEEWMDEHLKEVN